MAGKSVPGRNRRSVNFSVVIQEVIIANFRSQTASGIFSLHKIDVRAGVDIDDKRSLLRRASRPGNGRSRADAQGHGGQENRKREQGNGDKPKEGYFNFRGSRLLVRTEAAGSQRKRYEKEGHGAGIEATPAVYRRQKGNREKNPE